MKLKKIASLMLAGVMAVSMLTACGNNDKDNGQDGVVIETSSTSNAVNNGQSENNDVKVTFSPNATLTNLVSQIVTQKGDSASAADFLSIGVVTGKEYGTLKTTKYSDNDSLDGTSVTQLYVLAPVTYSATNNAQPVNEAAAMEMLARRVNDAVEDLKDSQDMDSVKVGDKYYAYDYTGEISDMVTLKKIDGTVSYYAVYTITQTFDQKTLEK